MNSIIIEVQAIPARRHELLQTLHDLASLKHRERGFIDARIRMDAENQNKMIVIEEWETQETLMAYMESELFQILRGALKLLTSYSEISFNPGEKHAQKHKTL